MEEDKLKEEDIVVLSEEEAYWTKLLKESDTMLERLNSSLKFESACNEMIKAKLEKAKNDSG
jgi:hypothetical protein